MTPEQIIEKQWQEATIQNNFVFSKTMELYPDLCRRLLEMILDIKIVELHYPEREKTIEARTDSKGIRLDVYVEESGRRRSFDVEMQVSNSDNLAKRMRYYQGLIDIDKLMHGQHYSALGESFIIFICPFDKFKQGRHMYSFREICEQDTKLKLNDGAVKIFLNTKGKLKDVSPGIKAFLDYVDRGIVKGKFLKELSGAVDSVKTNEKVRHSYMILQMDILKREMDAKALGLEQGLAQGLKQGLKQGLTQGLAQGKAEEREEIALKMIRRGRPFAEIHEDTGLSLQRINELAQKNSVE